MASPARSIRSDEYTVGWIAALAHERAAAEAMLDEEHETPQDFQPSPADNNVYTWGRMGAHNVVIASLPAGVIGTSAAAETAIPMISSLQNIRAGLLVGIGGGIPNPERGKDIRLGDIVVGMPADRGGGVIQHDLKMIRAGNKAERIGLLNKPPDALLRALAKLRSQHERKGSKIPDILKKMYEDNPQMAEVQDGYIHQGIENDRLFHSDVDHQDGDNCRDCDQSRLVLRDARKTTYPKIHYGKRCYREGLNRKIHRRGLSLFRDGSRRLSREISVSRYSWHMRLCRCPQKLSLAEICCRHCCCFREGVPGYCTTPRCCPDTAYRGCIGGAVE